MKTDRRGLLKGVAAGAAGLSVLAIAQRVQAADSSASDARHAFKPDRPITAITLGAGARGNVYGAYAASYPQHLNIVGVAEPIALRNSRYRVKHQIPEHACFDTWERVFEQPKFADAVIVSTPDALHYGPAMAALKAGYHVLLEKPVSPSLEECLAIRDLANTTGKIVAVCHVLRYTPYFRQLKGLIDAGAVGELVSVQHLEPIRHEHMAHSFVRGNWHSATATTPIILAKSCHDLDIMRWLVDKPCEQISAFGSLKWFRRENAPAGSTARCMDGCAVERECPYSAVRLYLEKEGWSYVFDLPHEEELEAAARRAAGDATYQGEFEKLIKRTAKERRAVKEQLLASTNYGRCVYRMENDQPDHYVASIQFADEVTASFAMEAFVADRGRQTRIMGSMGDISGNMREMTHTNFITGEQTRWSAPRADSNHGGGDFGLVFDWVRAIAGNDASQLSSTIDVSIESHEMGFKAEQSRLKGTVEAVGGFGQQSAS